VKLLLGFVLAGTVEGSRGVFESWSILRILRIGHHGWSAWKLGRGKDGAAGFVGHTRAARQWYA